MWDSFEFYVFFAVFTFERMHIFKIPEILKCFQLILKQGNWVLHSFYFDHAAFFICLYHDLFFSSSLISLTQFHVFCFFTLFLSPFSAALSYILFCDLLRCSTKLYKAQRLQEFSFALRSRSITSFPILTTFLSLIYYHVTQKNFRQRDSVRHTSGCLITSFNNSGKPFLITKIIPFILFFILSDLIESSFHRDGIRMELQDSIL